MTSETVETRLCLRSLESSPSAESVAGRVSRDGTGTGSSNQDADLLEKTDDIERLFRTLAP